MDVNLIERIDAAVAENPQPIDPQQQRLIQLLRDASTELKRLAGFAGTTSGGEDFRSIKAGLANNDGFLGQQLTSSDPTSGQVVSGDSSGGGGPAPIGSGGPGSGGTEAPQAEREPPANG